MNNKTHTVTIYHNPRCSKSRETLTLLKEKGITPEIILYLDTPPNKATLGDILKKLGYSSFRQIMRTKEELYTTLHLADPKLSEDALLAALVTHPKLLERPIVCHQQRACIGRPPSNVLALFT